MRSNLRSVTRSCWREILWQSLFGDDGRVPHNDCIDGPSHFLSVSSWPSLLDPSGAGLAALVKTCRYPPHGFRSFGPVRATWYAGSDYWQQANDTVLAIAMIETPTAMQNLDQILSVAGLDSIYIGPNDLALTLGRTRSGTPTDKIVVDAIKTILQGAKKHNVPAGIHCGSTAVAKEMIGLGFQFVTLLADKAFSRRRRRTRWRRCARAQRRRRRAALN